MRSFDYYFLEHGMLSAKFVNIVANINELNYHVNECRCKKKFEEIFISLENTAKVQPVKCSNALDGIKMTDDCIHTIVSQNIKPLNLNDDEVAPNQPA